MSKQKIEVGQVWKYIGRVETVTVIGVSPAWIRVRYEDDSEGSIRKGVFLDELQFYHEEYIGLASVSGLETPADPEIMLDGEPDTTTTHAAMQAAIHAFNVVTENRLTEPDGWAILHFFELALKSRKGLPISGMNFRTLHEESEIVE